MFNQKSLPTTEIVIKGQNIIWSKQAKYLGVIFDRGLNFNHHINYLISNATRSRCLLYPVLNFKSPISIKSKLLILQLYIRPALSYAGEAWGSQLAKSNWTKLETVQHKCIRTITRSPKFVSNSTII